MTEQRISESASQRVSESARKQEMKPWECKDGHVMGMIYKNSRRMITLLLYRKAIDMEKLSENNEIDIMASIDGYAADVKCSVCGDIRTWIPGEESIRRLLKQLERG